MKLKPGYVQCSPCSVQVLGLDRADVQFTMSIQYGEQCKRYYEPELREESVDSYSCDALV